MQPGDVIAERFELLQLAGEGGMGAVYRARDREGGGLVAVKVMRGPSDTNSARFRREAQVLAELEHPAVVRYVAHGVTNEGAPYLAMEWLEGEDLTARLRGGPLPIGQAIEVLERVAGALGAAHERGIVHRDVKPSNVFLEGGATHGAKLVDFGIAQLDDPTGTLTRTGATPGTLAYMAPEQARGERDVDARADVFALGCVAFECLTGRHAFAGNVALEKGEDATAAFGVMAVLAKILLEEAPRLRNVVDGIPRDLDELVASMLAKDRAARPRDGSVVARALHGWAPESARHAPVRALTRTEQRLLSVVLVPRRLAGDGSSPAPGELAREAAVAEAHGGTMQRLIDGSVVITMGTGSIASDQAAQAARCALALGELLGARPMALATGRGHVDRSLPVGEVIDRAAGMLAARFVAERTAGTRSTGGIAVDGVTAGLLDASFEVAGDGAGLELRGVRDRVEATRTLLGKPTPFVGRDRELASLEAILDECIEEPVARAVLVTAAAGVGKSRLRVELLRRVGARPEPIEIWIGRGDATNAGSAFGLAAQALRRAAGITRGDAITTAQRKLVARVGRRLPTEQAGRTAEFLAELCGCGFQEATSRELRAARHDPRLMGDQMRRAFEELVLAECAAQPLVLVLEDLHWGDAPTVGLCDRLLQTAREAPLLVLAFARPEVSTTFPGLWSSRDVQEVRLAGLTRKASERLVRQVLAEKPVDDAMIERLVRRADGNAFFLEELVRAAAEGAVDTAPSTVLAMAQARLQALEPDARRLLRAASILGRSFVLGAAAHLLGATGPIEVARLETTLGGLADEELVAPADDDGGYVLRHDLVREAAYAMLTDEDRELGHRLAAEWLEARGGGDAIALAEHFERGGLPARAVQYYARAAEEALKGDDLAAAISRAERGVACGAAGETLGVLRLIEAEAHEWSGRSIEGRDRSIEAMGHFERGSTGWYRAARQAIFCLANLAFFEQVAELGKQVAEAVAAPDAARAQRVAFARAAFNLLLGAKYDDGEALLRRLDGPSTDDPFVQAEVTNAYIVHALVLGDLGEAVALQKKAIDCYRAAGDRRNEVQSLGSLSYTQTIVGDHVAGERSAREALDAARRISLGVIADETNVNLGMALLHRGALAEAIALIRPAAESARAEGRTRAEGFARIYLALALLARGEAEAAEAEARRAVTLLVDHPGTQLEPIAVLADCLLARGLVDQARPLAEGAIEKLRSLGTIEEGESIVRLVHARVLDACGDRAAALAAIAEAKRELLTRAARIGDPACRKTFLENVPENARTLALAEEWLGEP